MKWLGQLMKKFYLKKYIYIFFNTQKSKKKSEIEAEGKLYFITFITTFIKTHNITKRTMAVH